MPYIYYMSCEHCCGVEKLFDEKSAKKQARRFRKGKVHKPTRILISALQKVVNSHDSLLDIGAGIGIIQHELLSDHIKSITNVDAASGYLKIAEHEAERAGFSDRVNYLSGDFIALANQIDAHQIVTLDKVVCCYPDAEKLLELSVSRSESLLGIVYPRDNFANRFFQLLGRVYFRVIGNPFRFFIHKDAMVDDVFRQNNFRLVSHDLTLLWQIRVYEKQPKY